MTKLRHYDDLGTARFVTFSCYYRLPSLNQPGAKEIVIRELDRARAKHGFQILGYVLMPDHVHLVLFPPEGMKLGLVIREIKSRSARRYFTTAWIEPSGGTRVFWQRRCYDHNLQLVSGKKKRSFDDGCDRSMRLKRSWILSHSRTVGHPG